ncbi:Acid phosphatase class B-like [Arabidopsis suecica]|uniref:Acid phosphatase class B-like n=1 Tax=Arabidopsis suecica TaxID=45249 RepID=A0A8T2AK49_ARASU|nr:Acid phosphatase class B-like [Arabidopsis suecica]
MSAYAHQMEREFSGLSSRGNSDLGSRYSMESGCYMTSLAASIFIASLVTFGVLMITLLIALSTMLQSCENRNIGIVEAQRLDESFGYCKILSLHSQLNSLGEESELPLLCRDVALRRIKQGIYVRELNFTIQLALTYFQTVKPMNDNRDVVVIDIDDSNLLEQESYYMKYIEEAKHQKSILTLQLYSKLRSQGYSMALLSRRPETERNATIEQLKSRGYSDWSHLIMREDTRQKEELERGHRVIGVIGNHMDVLRGQWNWQSKRLFKLPSLTYANVLDYSER